MSTLLTPTLINLMSDTRCIIPISTLRGVVGRYDGGDKYVFVHQGSKKTCLRNTGRSHVG